MFETRWNEWEAECDSIKNCSQRNLLLLKMFEFLREEGGEFNVKRRAHTRKKDSIFIYINLPWLKTTLLDYRQFISQKKSEIF